MEKCLAGKWTETVFRTAGPLEIKLPHEDPTCFCDLYSSFPPCTNDHFNGRIRGCLRKDTSLDDVTQEELDEDAKEINNRPSTVWGWLNPAEVFHEQCS